MRKLTQADRLLGEGLDIADVCRELGVGGMLSRSLRYAASPATVYRRPCSSSHNTSPEPPLRAGQASHLGQFAIGERELSGDQHG